MTIIFFPEKLSNLRLVLQVRLLPVHGSVYFEGDKERGTVVNGSRVTSTFCNNYFPEKVLKLTT